MSSKEIAYSIIDQLGEEELQSFITLFRRIYSPKGNIANDQMKSEAISDEINERRMAFERMKKACRYIPNLDEKKEISEELINYNREVK